MIMAVVVGSSTHWCTGSLVAYVSTGKRAGRRLRMTRSYGRRVKCFLESVAVGHRSMGLGSVEDRSWMMALGVSDGPDGGGWGSSER